MKNLQDGNLRRVIVQESESEDDLSLGALSDKDLSDSENEASGSASDDHDDYDEEDGSELDIQNDLAEIPFEKLIQAQSALKNRPAAIEGSRSISKLDARRSIKGEAESDDGKRKPLKRKRDNKHAPTEMSSKRTVGRSREAVEVVKIERRDPRFDPDMQSKSRTTNVSHSKRAYGFLDDYRKDEMRVLKQSIAREKDVGVRASMEKTLRSMQSREQAAQERERRERVLTEFKRKEKEAGKTGKIPFHLKEAEKNKLYLKDKFDSMDEKARGKWLEKRRKKRSQKDRKRALP